MRGPHQLGPRTGNSEHMTATSSGRLPARNTQAGTLSRVTEVTADEGPSRAQEATRSSTVPGGCWGPGLSHRWAGGPWRGTQPAHGDIAESLPSPPPPAQQLTTLKMFFSMTLHSPGLLLLLIPQVPIFIVSAFSNLWVFLHLPITWNISICYGLPAILTFSP